MSASPPPLCQRCSKHKGAEDTGIKDGLFELRVFLVSGFTCFLDFVMDADSNPSRKTRLKMVMTMIGLCLSVAWLFLGIFEHRYLFPKHRPSLKVYFVAPRGESDQAFSELPAHRQVEEKALVEFVEQGGGWQRAIYISISPLW